eukprot:716708-Prymnesium_polylepis.1
MTRTNRPQGENCNPKQAFRSVGSTTWSIPGCNPINVVMSIDCTGEYPHRTELVRTRTTRSMHLLVLWSAAMASPVGEIAAQLAPFGDEVCGTSVNESSTICLTKIWRLSET